MEAGVYNAMIAVLSQSGGDLNVTVKVGNTTLVHEVVKGYNRMKKSDPDFGFVIMLTSFYFTPKYVLN